jgi:hypothetical protein
VEIFGTKFALTIGFWRLRFHLGIEEVEEAPPRRANPPHHARVIPDYDVSPRR